jgi:cytochrome c-type biogenesis protein CcmH
MLVRLQVNGRYPLLTLGRRWATAPRPTSAGVLALVALAALSAFAAVSEAPTQPPAGMAAHNTPAPSPFDTDEELAALRSYAAAIDAPAHATAPAEAVPGVEEMIAKLKARLDEDPSDVKGWKMLGWSYLNTGQPADAARAYETAQKLSPADAEIRAALSAALSAAQK